jgi:hypothetical protein
MDPVNYHVALIPCELRVVSLLDEEGSTVRSKLDQVDFTSGGPTNSMQGRKGSSMASDAQRLPATAARRLRCPKCRSLTMRRIKRSGFLQKNIFPLLGYYPWECASCRLEKLFHNRGPKRPSSSTPK